ncbi:SGNH/GDSL hydrolase family protein [Streptomyces sp. NPDC049915]|uniref:SGNH/GDSL hydrolase family protein n=1 Tax=Streptomyces sp. NPDC049915 TaxID=3155510 RepID=UPI00343B941D
MARRHGYALLCAIVALITVVSVGIYAAVNDGLPGRAGTASTPYDSAHPASTGRWVGSWSASPSGHEPGTDARGVAGRSVRNVVHTGVGGTSARITLSNLYGRTPLTLTDASLAVAAGSGTAAARPGSMRRLTFGGATRVVVPAGAEVVSDPVRIVLPPDSDVLVSTYSPTPSGPVTIHRVARQISYAADGDHTQSQSADPYTTLVPYWRYLTALDVLSDTSDGTVVLLGDSITDGSGSTQGANRRWPDVLSDRLRAALLDGRDVPRYAVVNAGISGNRVLVDGDGLSTDNPSALHRFERDVLGRPDVKAVVIDLGVNDILRPRTPAAPERIVEGLRALVRQAHAHGLKVIGATLTPFGGHAWDTEERETVRRQVNAQIRAGRVFDAVVDFDKALRDPYDPRRLRAEYDCGDHLHPSDRGYRRMAEVFDLRELTGGPAAVQRAAA